MRILKSLILLVTVMMATSACTTTENKTPSLYDRLGGKGSITAVVNHLWGVVSKDERINQYFAHTDPAVFGSQLVDFLCQGSGGPCSYTGQSMEKAHTGMHVTSAAFDALAEDIVISLDHFNVPPEEKNEVMAMLGGMKNDIINH